MSAKRAKSASVFVDPDDAPEWTEDQLDRAEVAVSGEVVRSAQGTLTKRPGRPRLASPKQVVSLRLEPDVIAAFKGTGAGWQKRMGDVLKKSAIVREAASGAFKGVSRAPSNSPRGGVKRSG